MTERALQAEIMTRLRSWPVIALPIPNSLHLPRRTPDERAVIARVVYQMKNSGMLVTGSPDLVLFWCDGAAMCELKRPASRDLLGKRKPAGRPSEGQKAMAQRCADLRIKHCYASSWQELRAKLHEWGVDR